MGNGQMRTGWRAKVGLGMLVVSLGWPVLVPVLPLVGLSGGQIAAASGVMAVVAEILLVAGVALAGKEGYALIKSKALGFLKACGPPQRVGRARYTIGLVMFCLPLLLAWASPYFGHLIPGMEEYPRAFAIGGDLLLLVSLFVLGGDFWDKLRSLFLYDATVAIKAKPAVQGSA
jgi:hypothetical protein